MHYQISRNGQLYGPYTFDDLQRYLASGNIQSTDLVKSEEMPEWITVAQLMASQQVAEPVAAPISTNLGPAAWETPVAPAYAPAYAQPVTSPYENPPNLHWALVMLFTILTCGYFIDVWNIIAAAWLKRVQPNATSLFYYITAAALIVAGFFARMPFQVQDVMSGHYHPRYHVEHIGVGGLLWLVRWVVRLMARFQQRESLMQHYNTVEPIGLQLSGVMTFFFGGLYFQYHLNRINTIKAAALYGAARY